MRCRARSLREYHLRSYVKICGEWVTRHRVQAPRPPIPSHGQTVERVPGHQEPGRPTQSLGGPPCLGCMQPDSQPPLPPPAPARFYDTRELGDARRLQGSGLTRVRGSNQPLTAVWLSPCRIGLGHHPPPPRTPWVPETLKWVLLGLGAHLEVFEAQLAAEELMLFPHVLLQVPEEAEGR